MAFVGRPPKIGCSHWLEGWPLQQLELCRALLWCGVFSGGDSRVRERPPYMKSEERHGGEHVLMCLESPAISDWTVVGLSKWCGVQSWCAWAVSASDERCGLNIVFRAERTVGASSRQLFPLRPRKIIYAVKIRPQINTQRCTTHDFCYDVGCC